MASISKQTDGRKLLQYISPLNKRRCSIQLGKVSMKEADEVKRQVEQLVASKLSAQALPAPTAAWIGNLKRSGSRLYDRLSEEGLVGVRLSVEDTLLESFIDGYVASRIASTKESTRKFWGRTKKHLLDYFGADCRLDAITLGEAKRWVLKLKETLAENTVRRTTGVARQFFSEAVDLGLLDSNPFSQKSLPVATRGNKERMEFITVETINKVIDQCPDAQWRLLVTLARFGGLRVPSEALSLKWEDINWDSGRMTVRSPKTEHHEGRTMRVVPIGEELMQHLEEAFELAEDGDVYCIERYRDRTANLRTHFQRIIEKAGVKIWPRLWQNLRSTRQTELTREHPAHVVACWMGNSPKIANEHYLQVTEEDYASVAVGSGNRGKRAETTHDPKDVVPFVASSCRKLVTSSNSTNGPYRTRTMCKNHRKYATL
jgi:integrase